MLLRISKLFLLSNFRGWRPICYAGGYKSPGGYCCLTANARTAFRTVKPTFGITGLIVSLHYLLCINMSYQMFMCLSVWKEVQSQHTLLFVLVIFATQKVVHMHHFNVVVHPQFPKEASCPFWALIKSIQFNIVSTSLKFTEYTLSLVAQNSQGLTRIIETTRLPRMVTYVQRGGQSQLLEDPYRASAVEWSNNKWSPQHQRNLGVRSKS